MVDTLIALLFLGVLFGGLAAIRKQVKRAVKERSADPGRLDRADTRMRPGIIAKPPRAKSGLSDVLIGLLILVAVVGGLGLLIWKVFLVEQPLQVASIDWTEATKLKAMNNEGELLWTYDLPEPPARGQELILTSYGRQAGQTGPVRADLPAPGESFWHRIGSLPRLTRSRDEVLVAAEFERRETDNRIMAFAHSGGMLWQLTYHEAIGPIGERFPGTWSLKSWLVYSVAGRRRIALVLNQAEWPSVVVVADDSGSVLGRFVNAGRIDDVTLFTTRSRILLLLTGATASRDAGMLALVDALEPLGTSPEDPASPYDCPGCAPGSPEKYLVFPRSEVNVAARFPINQVSAAGAATRRSVSQRGFVVYTTENPDDRRNNLSDVGVNHSLSASYIFAPDLETLWRTSFEDDYWEAHRQFEMTGRISHSRDQCPERNGPRLVRAWDAQHGWHEMRPVGQ